MQYILMAIFLNMSKKKLHRLAHAEHNEKALKYIDKKPDYLDWVITMAFYSALHYARYRLFPLKDTTSDGKNKFEHATLDKYCSYYRGRQMSKHATLEMLLEMHCKEIASEYSRLMDLCKTARYHNYQYERAEANLAKNLLEQIKAYCTR